MKPHMVPALMAFIGLLIALGCDCAVNSNTSRDTPSPPEASSDSPRNESIEDIIAAGRVRPFGPLGPRFELEPALYERVSMHQSTAIRFLEKDITASDVVVRCNGYDFLAHIARKDGPDSSAYKLLKKGLKDESGMVRSFVRASLSEVPAAVEAN